jgi:hypothetical protein
MLKGHEIVAFAAGVISPIAKLPIPGNHTDERHDPSQRPYHRHVECWELAHMTE